MAADLTTTNKTPKAPKVASYDIARADETMALAVDLAKFIREMKLTHNVQGKEHVLVEGWQYAGSRLGIVPIIDAVISFGTEPEIKYSARVTLFDMRSGRTVGAGFSICSNKENGKKFFAEYAIASMAQTRAIGKAYRSVLGWIIRAAGYEPTPAEEMDYENKPEAGPVQPPMTASPGGRATVEADNEAGSGLVESAPTAEDTAALARTAVAEFDAARELPLLVALWTRWRQLQTHPDVAAAKERAKERLQVPPTVSANAPKLATDAQRALLTNLLKSHHLDAERDGWQQELEWENLPMDRISAMIDEATALIKVREQAERAAA